MRDPVDQLLLRRLAPVEIRLEHQVVRLRHRLDQPRPQAMSFRDQLRRNLPLGKPAEFSVPLRRIRMRPHLDQIDHPAERIAQTDRQLQRHRLGLEGLLDVIQSAQKAGPLFIELVHARQKWQRAFRRHVPVRLGLVLDTGHGGNEKESAFADRHRAIGIGEKVGEPGCVEQIQHHPVVLGEGDVRRHGEISLGLFRIDVEVAGGPVLRGARGRIVTQERFGERGLSCAVMGDDGDVADGLRIEHAMVSRCPRTIVQEVPHVMGGPCALPCSVP